MRHRVKTSQFGRSTKPRKALIQGMLRSLIEHGSVTTNQEKAKEIKRWADKLIGKAKTDTLASRRQLHAFFGKRDVVNTLVERVAPAMGKRISGFTTITRLGKRRGDNAQMVKLSLIEQPEHLGSLKNPNPKQAAPAAKKPTAKKAAPKKTTTKRPAAKKAASKKPTKTEKK